MADLSIEFCGIKAPNPFWLASAPPTDKAYNVVRAFEAGWGGVVWKTLGEDPAAVNVSSRYSALYGKNREVVGFNNIELITDRSLDINLREITQVKKDWPDRAMIVSLMLPCEEHYWADILPKVEATGADGIELNFGCPHGMPERGMGAAVGQVPEYVQMVTAWCKKHSKSARHRQAHAQYHGRAHAGARGQGGRRRRRLADQHHQLDYLAGPGPHGGLADRRRRQHARRLLRRGRQADRAEHGGRNRPRSARRAACPFPASAASATGATRRNFSPWAPAACRCARPPCCMVSASSKR